MLSEEAELQRRTRRKEGARERGGRKKLAQGDCTEAPINAAQWYYSKSNPSLLRPPQFSCETAERETVHL